MRTLWFDRAGQPITLAEADRLLSDADYRRVARTAVGDDEVSTVWLGVDHSFGLGGPPILFETMVFPACDVCERYATEDEARAGHELMVTRLRAADRPGHHMET